MNGIERTTGNVADTIAIVLQLIGGLSDTIDGYLSSTARNGIPRII